MPSAIKPFRSAHDGGPLSRLALAAGFLVALITTPSVARAQVDVTAGVLVAPSDGGTAAQVGPALSVWASASRLGLPLYLEVGVGRTDFRLLGQDYHDTHLLLAVGADWALRRGRTSLGFRLGIGANREAQTVEASPPLAGGVNWTETIVPGVVLTREIGTAKRLVVAISDAVLGPYYALLDPEEYGVEHRVRIMLGIRF